MPGKCCAAQPRNCHEYCDHHRHVGLGQIRGPARAGRHWLLLRGQPATGIAARLCGAGTQAASLPCGHCHRRAQRRFFAAGDRANAGAAQPRPQCAGDIFGCIDHHAGAPLFRDPAQTPAGANAVRRGKPGRRRTAPRPGAVHRTGARNAAQHPRRIAYCGYQRDPVSAAADLHQRAHPHIQYPDDAGVRILRLQTRRAGGRGLRV